MSIKKQNRPSDSLSVDIPNVNRTRKRWRFAYAVIYSVRAIAREILAKTTHTVLEIKPSPTTNTSTTSDHHFPNLNKESLTKLVKEKDLNFLAQLGGVDGVVSKLETNPGDGISNGDDYEEDIKRRRRAFGSNAYERRPPKGFLYFFFQAFKDATIVILLVCAALSLGFGIKEEGIEEGWYNGGSILFAVVLVVVVSAVTNSGQSKQFDKLSRVSGNIQVEVVRNGRRCRVSVFDVVVGDVVMLKIGDQVPADGLFLEGYSLQLDQSSMTGESDYVDIDRTNNPFLLSGAKVANGYARMVVTAVGMNTEWGEMMSSISHDLNEETPLQSRLNKLTSSIGKLGLLFALLVLVAMLARYFTGSTKDANGNREFNGKRTKLDDIMNAMVHIVAASVTILVVAIPEGLPLAVTLTLAYSMKRMMADQAMVRKLSACETMGSADTICTDKTGTLTMNQMKVTTFWVGKDEIGGNPCEEIAPNVVELMYQGVGLNTTGSVYRASSESVAEFSGSPTEKAILAWAIQELGMEVERIMKNYVIVHVETFNSETKRSGVSIRRKEDNTVLHVHWKGAAEIILGMCSNYYDKSGSIKEMDEGTREGIGTIIKGLAENALRCIAFAHKIKTFERKDVKEQLNTQNSGIKEPGQILDENDLTFLGIVGLKDPCRPGVKEAVQLCKTAGVNVMMITGDNIFTAKAIAMECEILDSNQGTIITSGEVIEGEEFRNYTQQERMKRADKIRVMARSSPLDKLLMVKCLKQKGQVVAVTGDGTNDAPALKEADVGLSMGIQGTEVAKESSDIVILDDNFSSVVTVLKWGRCVYNSIQKFIQFQLTVNVAALVINLVAACSAGEVPLTAVQLLWVNLIMDTLGALALAAERPTNELMEKPPVGRRTEPLITNVMWRNLISQALFQITILLVFQFKIQSVLRVNVSVKNTLIFNTFVFCQVFNEFNARKLEKKNVFEGILENRLFLWIVGITVLLQVVMVEFLQKFANTVRLNWWQWLMCVVVAAMTWPLGWIVKSIPVPRKPFMSYVKLKCFKNPPP